jgi:hypothetical protein
MYASIAPFLALFGCATTAALPRVPPALPHPSPPTVYQVIPRDPGRAWIILDVPAPSGVEWTVLAPDTFDNTSIAPAPRLERPRSFTLAGPEGSCEIASADQLFVSPGLGPSRLASAAIEVDLGECRIGAIAFALEGGAGPAIARRRSGVQDTSPPGVARWVEDRIGAALAKDWQSDERAVYREWVPGTEVEAIYAFLAIPTATSDATAELLLRRGDRLLARFRSAELAGSLRVGGLDYAIVVDGASARAVDLTR